MFSPDNNQLNSQKSKCLEYTIPNNSLLYDPLNKVEDT